MCSKAHLHINFMLNLKNWQLSYLIFIHLTFKLNFNMISI